MHHAHKIGFTSAVERFGFAAAVSITCACTSGDGDRSSVREMGAVRSNGGGFGTDVTRSDSTRSGKLPEPSVDCGRTTPNRTRGTYWPSAELGCDEGGSRTFSLHPGVRRGRPNPNLHPYRDGPAADTGNGSQEFAGDDNLYAGVWRGGTYPAAAWFTTSWNEFTQVWDDWGQAGLRMEDFETFTIGGTRVYAGIFRAGNGAHAAWFTSDWNGFTNQWNTWGGQGLRMEDFETFVAGGTRVFAGVFRAGTDGHAAWFTSDWNEFTSIWDTYGRRRLRMHDFEVYFESGTPVYAGIFRGGNDANAALFTSDAGDFFSTWDNYNQGNLRMHDLETYDVQGTRVWAGAWREGNDANYAWVGVDWENFVSKWHELEPQPLRMTDVETYPSACPAECLNQLVMHPAQGEDPLSGLYDYGITRTATHCPGLPGTCGTPGPNEVVLYRQPVVATPNGRYVRFPAVTFSDQLFTLPVEDAGGMGHNGWLYKSGSWHHAIDYGITGAESFDLLAAADGTVVHVGWDAWSGGTIVVSHDAGGISDAYRTIYMHVRNGADADCQRAWDETYYPNQTQDFAPHYKEYLEVSGCAEDPADRELLEDRWGKNSEAISQALLGSEVERGQVLARAGSTGPGGCGCIPEDPANAAVGSGGTGPNTHLHIFFARRDLGNDEWYFFDPYGMYAPSSCYPAGMTDALPAACARYPIAWQGGVPQFP